MRLTESVKINATAETIWYFLDDPELVKTWSPKLIAWEPVSQGPRGKGYAFRVQYGMSGKRTWWDAEFSEYHPYTRLVWSMRDPQKPTLHNSQLTFELNYRGKVTHLTQVIEFPDAMIPMPVRWLIKFLYQFGTPQGERYLHTLKRLAEDVEST